MWGWDVTVGGTTGWEDCTAAEAGAPGCQAGIAGDGDGQFYYPAGVATDSSERPRRRLRQQPNPELQLDRQLPTDLGLGGRRWLVRVPDLHERLPDRPPGNRRRRVRVPLGYRDGPLRQRLRRRRGQQPDPEVQPDRQLPADVGLGRNRRRWHRLRDLHERSQLPERQQRERQRSVRICCAGCWHRHRLLRQRLRRRHRQRPDPEVQLERRLHRRNGEATVRTPASCGNLTMSPPAGSTSTSPTPPTSGSRSSPTTPTNAPWAEAPCGCRSCRRSAGAAPRTASTGRR